VRRPVNDAQRAVLAWLASGATTDPPAPIFKLSAVALQSRGLVKVRRVSGKWTATLTDDGRYFAGHGSYPPEPKTTAQPDVLAPSTSKTARSMQPKSPVVAPVPAPDLSVDSPHGVRARGLKPRGDALRHPEDPDPWDRRIVITVKEAAWLLSISENEIRRAVTSGEIDRVFIGKGTTHYRIVYGALLAWVNDMPRESSRYSWWSQ